MKRNVPALGLVIGLLMPLLGAVVCYLLLFRSMTVGGFLHSMTNSHSVASKVLSLAIIANLLPFMLYTNRRLDLTGRGILVATMLYAVVIIWLKVV